LWSVANSFVEKSSGCYSEFIKQYEVVDSGFLKWVVMNRIRYLFVKELSKVFSGSLFLVGNDWTRYGFAAQRTNFDIEYRESLYASSRVCLDLLSKSSDDAHYPRSAEIISNSNGILQLRTHDSPELFGDQLSLRTFADKYELIEKVNMFFLMKESEYVELGRNLRESLIKKQSRVQKHLFSSH
jgi:hypothetical protein